MTPTSSSKTSYTLTCGFKPTYIYVTTADGKAINVYNANRGSQCTYAGSSTSSTLYTPPIDANRRISSITSTGFTFLTADAQTYYWIAVAD